MRKVHHASPRARRVIYPAIAVVVVAFVSFGIHMLVLGTSAFPGGKSINGRYFVEEHGRVIELSRHAYWFSYIHGVAVVVVFAVFFIIVGFYYFTGDLEDACTDT